MPKLLFICSQNRLRSPTAQAIFSAYPGVEAKSAGLDHDAENPVSADLIEGADVVFVMEKSHKNKLRKRFGKQLETKKVVVLNIPDEYEYMQPELVRLLKAKVSKYLPARGKAE